MTVLGAVGYDSALDSRAPLRRPRPHLGLGRVSGRLLVFPDENRWVPKSQHAKLPYQTVFAFLAHTVHGRQWEAPDQLR